MLKKCPVCGKPIDAAANKCKFCNSHLIDLNKKIIWQSESENINQKFKFRNIMYIISVIFILFLSYKVYSNSDYLDDKDWSYAVKQNTFEAYKKYISIHKSGKHVAKALNILDDCCWQKAITINTEIAYLNYLKLHPKGKYSDLAKRNADELAWKKACESNDKNLILEYIKKYPDGIFIECAKYKLKTM